MNSEVSSPMNGYWLCTSTAQLSLPLMEAMFPIRRNQYSCFPYPYKYNNMPYHFVHIVISA